MEESVEKEERENGCVVSGSFMRKTKKENELGEKVKGN